MKNSGQLSFAERERISILRAKGYGVRRIARALNRSPGTISEEIKRNVGRQDGGRAERDREARESENRGARRERGGPA